MKYFVFFSNFLLISLLFSLDAAHAFERRALVIGNSDYSLGALRNTVNDAKDIKSVLEDLNFKTEMVLDADIGTMEKKIDGFCTKLSEEKTDIAFFYYSGHGVSIKDTNYLLPVSLENLSSRANVQRFSVSASWVVARMEESGSKLNIMVLDACRNTPKFSVTKSPQINTGFTDMKCPEGTIIAYSSQNLAYDSLGSGDRNGVYTGFLKKNLKKKGLSVIDVFNQTGLDVVDATSHKIPKQVPSVNFTATPPYYLAGGYIKRKNNGLAGSSENNFIGNSKKEFTNLVGMKFVWIKPGTFKMGSPESEPGRDDDENLHMVKLTRGFYMQTTEVTQGQYKAVMGENPSDYNECGDNCPVENVSWYMADEFIKKLNKVQDKYIYSLPTEAQWEYCARAGTRSPFAFGDCLSTEHANYDGNYPLKGCIKGEYRKKIIPAGSLKANSWGLYDMHGNVREWCKDWYGKYPTGIVKDPAGAKSGSNRVSRGGSWDLDARSCRSANRNFNSPGVTYIILGFRVVASQADR